MRVKLRRIDQNLPLPQYATTGACAFDICAREQRTVQPQAIELLPSNLIIKTPANYVLLIAPRSSLARKKGLIMPNSIGVVDQDYAGADDEIMIQVQNITNQPVTVDRGERIAQGLFLKMERADWQEVGRSRQKSRGGFGSTGGYQKV